MRIDPIPTRSAARPPGFTLIEIMAVMAVIAILLSVAAIGIQNIQKGQATTTALAVTEALFEEARGTAIGRGTRARLLIHAELDDSHPLDRVRYLGFMCVAALKTDADGNPTNEWEIISRGTQLPSGVYFSPEQTDETTRNVKDVGKYGEMKIALPGDPHTQKKCYYYEFNSEGVCVDSEMGTGVEVNAGGVVVLVSGIRPKGAAEPIVRSENKVGFVIWRRGTTSLFRNPEQFESR